jgi:hypothetical protein
VGFHGITVYYTSVQSIRKPLDYDFFAGKGIHHDLSQGIHSTQEYLNRFFGTLAFGETSVLKNLELLAMPENTALANVGENVDAGLRVQPGLSAKELAVSSSADWNIMDEGCIGSPPDKASPLVNAVKRIMGKERRRSSVIKMQIVMDDNKITREHRYSVAKIHRALDEFMVDTLRLAKDGDGFYLGTNSRKDFSTFGIAFNTLRKKEWFACNVKTWLYFNSDASVDPNDFVIEDFKDYCENRMRVII